MRFYSDFPARRTLQIVVDLLALLVVVLAIWAATAVYGAVVGLAVVGDRIRSAGTDFHGTMADAGRTLGGVPLIGRSIRAPFDGAAGAGTSLADAGRSTRAAIETGAWVLALLTVAVPIAVLIWQWLPRRLRFAVRATRAAALARLEDGTDVLALRALTSASARGLRSVSPTPATQWRRADPRAIRELAALELREAGVRLARI